jgi:hypothetical protein
MNPTRGGRTRAVDPGRARTRLSAVVTNKLTVVVPPDQLRIVLRGLSPLIWWCMVVLSDTAIAELQHVPCLPLPGPVPTPIGSAFLSRITAGAACTSTMARAPSGSPNFVFIGWNDLTAPVISGPWFRPHVATRRDTVPLGSEMRVG